MYIGGGVLLLILIIVLLILLLLALRGARSPAPGAAGTMAAS